MAKKNKRMVSSASVAPTANRATEFNPYYSHVKRDLNRIGVIAGSFFVILIALSFFIK